MFLSLLPVEKPGLGRGLDALMSGRKGESGTKAKDLLMPFQAKRTRVGKGLGAFLKDRQRISAPMEPPPRSPRKAKLSQSAFSMSEDLQRVARQARLVSKSNSSQVVMPNYRLSRRHKPASSKRPFAVEESEPASAQFATPVSSPEGKVPPDGEPLFQKPIEGERLAYSDSDPVAKPPVQPPVSPAFRLSLFLVDWFLCAGAFYVMLTSPHGSYIRLTLCCLAVVIGAAMGVWGLKLESEREEG
mgnify:CR=1 FL=1